MATLIKNLTPTWTGSEFTNSSRDKSKWSSIYEDYIIIGGNNITVDSEQGAGAAFIYKKVDSEWLQQAKLTQDNPDTNSYYGESVAINNQYAIVGAPMEDSVGAVYIYSKNGTNWNIHAKLTYSSVGFGFGHNVSINETDNTLIVNTAEMGTTGRFSIYTLSGDSWSLQAEITDSAFSVQSCSICEETIVVGGPISPFGSSGTVRVYTRSESIWSLQATLEKTPSVFGDNYGYSVSLSGEYLAIGTPGDREYGDDETGYANLGSIYVWKKTDTIWEEQAKLTALMQLI